MKRKENQKQLRRSKDCRTLGKIRRVKSNWDKSKLAWENLKFHCYIELIRTSKLIRTNLKLRSSRSSVTSVN